MSRQRIALTEKNDKWLKSQVEATRDYANKNELVNDLIRRAGDAEEINQRLESAENSGFVAQSPEDMLKEFKADLKRQMNRYKLSLNAKQDLKRIYAYGFAEYGELQADKYFEVFFHTFEKIATTPAAYQSVEHIRKGYRRCAYGADSIYYRFNGVEVEIMAILGGQDVDEWL